MNSDILRSAEVETVCAIIEREKAMEQLIEALQIFLKYKNEKYPTHCEHDVMYIMGVDKSDVSPEDIKRLDELGFFWGEDGVFMSFKYGSA